MNSVLLQGTIAAQPELAYTQDGATQYTTFSLSFPGQKPEDPDGVIKAIAWGNLAQTVASYSPGLELVLEGRVDIRKVEREGYNENVPQFVANRVHLVSATTPMPAQTQSVAPAAAQPAPAAAAGVPAASAKAKTQAKTPVTPVAAMASGSVAPVEDYEPNYEDIPF